MKEFTEFIELEFNSGRIITFEVPRGTYEILKFQVSQGKMILVFWTEYIEFHVPCWLLAHIYRRSN